MRSQVQALLRPLRRSLVRRHYGEEFGTASLWMVPRAQWVRCYVTDDKIYCVSIADDEAAVREHARRGGFPADSVSAIHAVIDPTTGEAA